MVFALILYVFFCICSIFYHGNTLELNIYIIKFIRIFDCYSVLLNLDSLMNCAIYDF